MTWDAGGPLSLGFMRWAGDVSEFSPLQLANLQRAYFAGASFLIAVIEEAKTPEEASQICMVIKAEAHCLADILNLANEP